MKSHRQDEILRCMAEAGVLSVEAAVRRFNASVATVRRDFTQLAKANLVKRVRGGIQLVDAGDMQPFAVREVFRSNEKMLIAKKAASLLQPGDVVFVDGGTTTLQLAACLPPVALRIITNSLSFAEAVERRVPLRNRWELFLTGGYLFPNSGLLVGPGALSGVTKYHADWAMMSAGSIGVRGAFNDNEHVVETERGMIANAAKVAILADYSKLERQAMCHIAGLDKIDCIVTDAPIVNGALQTACKTHGVEILRALP